MAGLSAGDVLLLGVTLGVATAEVTAGIAAVLAGIAVVLRFGSSSLGAVAGAQDVLGPAGWVGPPLAAAGSWAAAGALVLASGRGLAAVPFGLAAAVVVAGPGVDGSVWMRLAAAPVGVGLAWVAASALPRWLAAPAAVTAGAAGCVLAIVA